MTGRAPRHLPALLAVAALTAGCGVATPMDGGAAAAGEARATVASAGSGRTTTAGDPTAIPSVAPLPGSLVLGSATTLRARVASDTTPEDVVVRLDGTPVEHEVRPVEGGVEVVADLRDLDPGDRELSVEVRTDEGSTSRTWSATATDLTSTRRWGDDRLRTAVAISRATHGDGSAPAAVLARDDAFADALAGGPLAAHLGGPLLLTPSTALADVTATELTRVLEDGAPVHVLGGETAITASVVEEVEGLGHPVVRHAGPDRYATAARIAAALPPTATAFVAAGDRFPDALAASVPAAREGWPVLLTPPDALADATASALERLGTSRAIVVGGHMAVSRGTADAVDRVVDVVERVAGPTRHATAVAIADTFLPAATEIALASGRDHPDALAAAAPAAHRGAPLLLLEPGMLPPETGDALRRRAPTRLVLHGGPLAVSEDVLDAVRHAVVDGPGGPRVTATSPVSGARTATIAPVVVDLDRPVVAEDLVASASLDGREWPAAVRLEDGGTRLVVEPQSTGDLPLDDPHEVRVVVRARTSDGGWLHHAHRFVLQDRRVFATTMGLELVEPSRAVEFVGYHQSNHEGARDMTPASDGPPWRTLESRGRLSGAHSAADVVADEHVEVVAPVSGRVKRAGTYVLYCDFTDNSLVIEPDGMPGYEVKLLHFRGLRVSPGDRVEAGETVVGDGPRRLPFESQVDRYSSTGYGPHVHVEVVDTSIPNVSNGGSGSEDC